MLRAPDQSRLTVTNQTSLAKLKRFSEQAGGNAKIRGDRNADGSITLYASTKKGTGLAAKLGRDRGDHQAAAREAVNTVLSGVKGGGQTLNFAMTHVKGQLPAKGELLGAGLAAVVQGASAAREHAVTNARDFPQIGAALEGALAGGNAETVKHLTAELGGRMAAYMQTKSPDQQTDFVISRGDGLKGAALGALCAGHGGAEALMGAYANDGPLKAVLDDAYQQATQRLPNHQNGDGTLEIGGKTYAKDRHLAEGGFGSVDIYKAADGEEIAVKTPTGATAQERAEKFDEAARGVDAHRSAVAGNPANVVGLKGVVRTPEGGIQIALGFASRGDAYGAIDKLNKAAQNNQITPQEANLARVTMIKDMIEGLRHVQDTRGMTHLDVKSPNFFVDAGGVVKLGDVGTASEGGTRQLKGNPIQNPRWAAPELIKGGNDYNAKLQGLRSANNNAMKTAASALTEQGLSPGALKIAKENVIKKI